MAAQPLSIDPPPPASSPSETNDIALLHEGEQALEERLGPEGLLRFLQLVGGEQRQFAEIRKQWQDLTMDEALAEMGLLASGPAPKTSP